MDRNVAIGIIVFNPAKSVLERIKIAINSGFKVYVFDNSPDNALIRDYAHSDMTDQSQITYITCGKNVGLGYGLAAICAQSYYDFFPTLLFFDQDTIFSSETLSYISSFYMGNSHLADSYSAIVFNSKTINAPKAAISLVSDVRLAINSGSLYYLKNLKKMNWHSTKYFVDCVDYEFCLASSNYHLKIGEHSATPGFDHCTEQGDTHFKVFGVLLPMRVYRLSRIWDAYSASIKLIFKAIVTWNLIYAFEFFKSIHKYLFVQLYIRIAKIFHVRGKSVS